MLKRDCGSYKRADIYVQGQALTETKVAGKKVIVTTAIAFIAMVSLTASSAMAPCTWLSRCATMLKAQ
jgi:hypothetical protein